VRTDPGGLVGAVLRGVLALTSLVAGGAAQAIEGDEAGTPPLADVRRVQDPDGGARICWEPRLDAGRVRLGGREAHLLARCLTLDPGSEALVLPDGGRVDLPPEGPFTWLGPAPEPPLLPPGVQQVRADATGRL
jgi:hypothetical protein